MLQPQGRVNVAEALAAVPSLFTKNYGNLTTIGLRGANAEQTLILLDGVPLNSAQDNLADLVTLPLVLADRIEVVAGANSALYGANSIGGLVNIMPAEPDSFTAAVTAGLGSLGRRYAQLVHTNRFEPFGYVLTGNLSRTGASFSYRDTSGVTHQRVNSDWVDAGLMTRATYHHARHALSLLAEYHNSRRGVPGPTTWPSDSARLNDSRTIIHLGHDLPLTEHCRLETRLHHHRFWRHYWNPDPMSLMNDTHLVTASGLALKQTTHLFRWATTVAGVEGGHDRLRSTAIGLPGRWNWAGWFEARLGGTGFEATPMARLDLSNSANPADTTSARTTIVALSPKLFLAGSPLPGLTLYAAVGRSFRQPTFNELFWPRQVASWPPYTFITQGNPRLKPEWSTNADLGISGERGETLHCRLGWYWSRFSNLIQWQTTQQGDTSFTRPVNLDTATITGVEVELGTALRHGGITATGTGMLARSAGKDLVYRPRLTFGAHPWLLLEPVRISIDASYVGPRYTVPNNTDSLPGFVLVDAGFSLSPRLGLLQTALRTGVRNLFDRQYQVLKDYPLPGRTFYAELSVGI